MIDSNDCENWSFLLDVILSGNVFEMQRDEKMMFSSKINGGIWNRRWINFFINLDNVKGKKNIRTYVLFFCSSKSEHVDFYQDGGYNNSLFLNVCIIKIMLLEISKA